MLQPNVGHSSRSPRHALLILALTLTLILSGLMPVLAQPTAQGEDLPVMPLMLGEYAQADLAGGDSLAYGVVLPEDGDYLITAVDEEAAVAFDLLVTDVDGNIVSDDVFGVTDLTLTAGAYTLTFTATEDGNLFFVVLGNLGEVRQSAEDPGKLIPGGIVLTKARSSDDYYAILSVPALDVPQEVLLYAESSNPDQYLFVAAEGPDFYDYIDAQETQLLRFWTEGGDYTITATPSARNQEFTLIPFLSGPPQSIEVGGSLDDSLDLDTDKTLFLISLDSIYTDLTITLAGEDDDADLDLLFTDGLNESSVYESSADTGSQEEIALENVLPGDYYIIVTRYGSVGSAFTLSVEGEAGEPFAQLQSGEPMDGALLDEEVDSETVYYEFVVEEAASLIQVDLLSDSEDTYFDINVGRRPGNSNWYGYGYDGTATANFMATEPGTYYISVVRTGTPTEFSIMAENLGPAPALITGDYVRGQIADGNTDLYQLEISEPGQILSLVLVSLADKDLDLQIVLYNKYGDSVVYQSSAGAGGVESVTQAMAEPGLYEVQVRAYDDDEYYLFTEVTNPYNLVNVTLDVTNLTGGDVCSVIATNMDGEESGNLLAEETPLADGESIFLTLPTDTYILDALDCDDALVASEQEVFLQGEMYWDLTAE